MSDGTLPEQVAQSLRRAILRGDIAPGEPIKERDGAAGMGVSRTPMREAIRILAKEGLVTLRPSRSPVVADPSETEIVETIELLSVLELTSAEAACARATDDEIAGIAAIQHRMEAEFDATDPIDVFEMDMAFHLAIVRAGRNARIAEAHGAALSRLWRVRYLSSVRRRSRERVLSEHRAILDGLLSRDARAVRAALSDHLDHLSRNVLAGPVPDRGATAGAGQPA